MEKGGTIKIQANYELYLVTDESMSVEELARIIEEAIKGGVTIVQLREKRSTGETFYKKAKYIKPILEKANIPLIINDRIDLALAVGASGVHIGQEDIPLQAVKEILPSTMVIGVSVSTVEEAIEAERNGADYIGVGAAFPTTSKNDANVLRQGVLAAITQAVDIPVIAIGGINQDNFQLLKGQGLAGVAVVSAIMHAEEPYEAALSFREMKILETSPL